MKDKIGLQNEEFDAIALLAKTYNILMSVAVVDDDYPTFRKRYEDAMALFIKAIRANGRIT